MGCVISNTHRTTLSRIFHTQHEKMPRLNAHSAHPSSFDPMASIPLDIDRCVVVRTPVFSRSGIVITSTHCARLS